MARAIVKAAAGKKRAAFAIEDAIADTRSRIAASAGADLRQKAQAALAGSPKLSTERDGRMFAIAVMEHIKEREDEGSAYPYSTEYEKGDEIKPYRTGPQWDGFYKDLSRLVDATDDARKGFATIFTDALTSDGIGYPEQYRAWEREGKYLPWGTHGTAHPKPKARALTKAERKGRQQAMAKAKGPRISTAEVQAVEDFLTVTGQARRTALAFLARPYADMAKEILGDKKAALAFARVAAALEAEKGAYLTIAAYVADAARDICRAISERKDGAAMLGRARSKRAKG